jgi:hypothetical protein
MNIPDVIVALDAEIARLQQARTLIDGWVSSGALRLRSAKRTLSSQARKKIADAQRRRWAKQRSIKELSDVG